MHVEGTMTAATSVSKGGAEGGGGGVLEAPHPLNGCKTGQQIDNLTLYIFLCIRILYFTVPFVFHCTRESAASLNRPM